MMTRNTDILLLILLIVSLTPCPLFAADDDPPPFSRSPTPSPPLTHPEAPTQPPRAVLFAHSPHTLFRVDPEAGTLATVGVFKGCGQVVDIAFNSRGELYATTFSSLFRVDPMTAACTRIAHGHFPNSLGFVPAGTLDPDEETLVGFLQDIYVRIDTKSGQVSVIGRLGQGLVSSGDLITVPKGRTYLTVKGPACIRGDCLIEVDPSTGALRRMLGELGVRDVYGLAFSEGRAYGFSDHGTAFEVQFESQQTLSIRPLPFAQTPAGLRFWGAASQWR